MNFSKKYSLQNYTHNQCNAPPLNATNFCLKKASYKKFNNFKVFNNNNHFKYFRKNMFTMDDANQNGSKTKRTFDEMNENQTDQNQNWKKLHCETDELNLTDLINEANSNSSTGPMDESSVMKNSIQKLYEIKRIKKVTFDMLSSDGPSHKPSFKFGLSFDFNNVAFKFEGEGASKKNAKSIASLKALYFLNRVPQFFSLFDSIYVGNLIKQEMKAILGLSENVENYFLESLDHSQKEFLQSKEQSSQEHIAEVNTLKVAKSTIDWDLKIKEILASKSSLIILNHLIPSSKFELKSEEGSSHAKLFKIELKISKASLEELKMSKSSFIKSSLLQNLSSLLESSSVLISSNENDLIFQGSGNSKKQAKSKAAQLAIESIFNIKIIPEGKFM